VADQHVVFTRPAALPELARPAPRLVYRLLLPAASATAPGVAADPTYLGAPAGLRLVLPTGGQGLHRPPHVQGLVPAGGRSGDASGQVEAGPRWVACRPGFFRPVRVPRRAYRGKFVAGSRAARARGAVPGWAEAAAWPHGLAGLYAHGWVGDAPPPAPGPAVVLEYLARSVSRVAVSAARLVRVADGQGTCTATGSASGGGQEELALSAVALWRRWPGPVLPRGFGAARPDGLVADRGREAELTRCRHLLGRLVSVVVGVEPGPSAAAPACPRGGAGPRVPVGAVAPGWLASVDEAVAVDRACGRRGGPGRGGFGRVGTARVRGWGRGARGSCRRGVRGGVARS
jgi:hypothetical protein